MSIVMKSNFSSFTDPSRNSILNSLSLMSQNDDERQYIDYELSGTDEKNYLSSETKAIIILEMVRGVRWRPSRGAEEIINCPAGMVFVIPAGSACSIVWPRNTPYLIVTLDEECFPESKSAAEDNSLVPIYFTNRQCLQIAQILWGEIQATSQVNTVYIHAFRTVLAGILARNALAANGGNRHQFGLSNYASRQVEAYLKENFRQPVSVPDMAALIGISAGHFATCFRASFGSTPHQYLMRLRLDEVERCLRETDMPLSEIAASLGFSSQSHMTTALRKYRHLTPGELRRRSHAQRHRKDF